MPRPDAYLQTQPASRAEWRQWLAENHARSPGVWLVYCKKASGQPSVRYAEAVEEALCFGWIDSLPRKLDADRTRLLFTPRQPKNGWSKVNKERLVRLEQASQLRPRIARPRQDRRAPQHRHRGQKDAHGQWPPGRVARHGHRIGFAAHATSGCE